MSANCTKDFTLVINDTPTAYWKFDSTLIDSVNGLVLADNGQVNYAPGLIGNAFQFPPTLFTTVSLTLSASAGVPYSAGNGISFGFWLQWSADFDANDQFVVDVFNFDDSLELRLLWNTTNLVVSLNNNVDSDSAFMAFTPTLGHWYFFVVVYDGGTGLVKVYQDNAVILSTTVPVIFPTAATNTWRIRELGAAGGSTMDLLMDEMGLWMNAALATDFLTSLYNSGNGRTYPFT